jgi:glycosyltransferase involved in cell wall biosynthesis
MVMFSFYPTDPRPRRAVDALLNEGATVDLICLRDETSPQHERLDALSVRRISIKHRRSGKLSYLYQYCAFILTCGALLAIRSLRRRYDLVYVHNMPDVLVASALIPKALGAKVVLDQHDPMPELMTTIFGLGENSFYVRVIKWLEKWSFARADLVLTVNQACQRIFAGRSCSSDKIGVVMNAPDGDIFPLRTPHKTSGMRHSGKNFVIMYHGSLVERNGLDLAVKALELLLQTVPHAELRIYGKATPFLNDVLREAETLGVQKSVRYLGPKTLEELVPEIDKCHVGIIPNQRNAFTDINTPTRIFEYLASGKPVIAPATQGILDYFGEGSLLLIEPGNSADLARRLEYVAHHYQDAIGVAERGQEVYLKHTWTQEKRTLVHLLGTLLLRARA